MTRASLALLLAAAVTACATPPAPEPPVVPPATSRPQLELGQLSAAARATDKGPSQHNYTDLYERLFLQWKDDPIRIFEIGVAGGGSLAMWQAYFPNARIFAADIVPKTEFDTPRVTTLVADQADRGQLAAALKVSGSDFDILVDDGGHTMAQQQVSLGYLFPHLRGGGYYVIEDVHTSLPDLWQGYGVSRDGRNTTLRMLETYVRTAAVRSAYMTADEMAYLNANVESVVISHRTPSRSIMAVIRKKAPAAASAPPRRAGS